MALGAPVRLVRFPASLLAVMGTALILGIVASSAPLFLSAVGASALHAQVNETRAAFGGLIVTDEGPLTADRIAYRQRLLTRTTAPLRGLGAPTVTLLGTGATVASASHPGVTAPVQPLSRTGFGTNIQRLSGGGDDGIWLADTTARTIGVQPGDRVLLTSGDATVSARVAGTYRALSSIPLTPYWSAMYQYIWTRSKGDFVPLPPFAMTSQSQLLQLESASASSGLEMWDYPLTPNASLETAQRLGAQIRTVQASFADPRSTLGSGFVSASSGLLALLGRASSERTQLAGAVGALATAGLAVTLLTLALAGAYGYARRRSEFGGLRARGVGPIRAGGRAAIEAALPVAIGVAAGCALALGLFGALGTGPVTSQAMRSAVRWSAVAALVGIAVYAITVAATAVREPRSDRHRTRAGLRRTAARIPWEVPALAIAAAALWEIRHSGAGAVAGGPHVDRLVGLFPVLFVAALSGLAVRGLRRLLPRLRPGGSSTPWFLAVRRAAAAPATAGWLVTASAVAIGMLVYGGVLAASLQSASAAKGQVAIGSDVAVDVSSGTQLPRGSVLPATVVQRIPGVAVGPGEHSVDVLGVDPSTFARAAYWQGRFGGSLPGILNALTVPASAGSPVPVVVVNGNVPAQAHLETQGFSIPIRQVVNTSVFPGMSAGRTLIVANATALSRAMVAAGLTMDEAGDLPQIWARGDPATILPQLGAAGVPLSTDSVFGARITPVHTAAAEAQTSRLQAITWTLGYLRALGLLSALLALAGIALYLQTRQRARQVSFALASRMGLRANAYRTSVALELACMLGMAFVVGSAIAILAAALVVQPLDPLGSLPPGAQLALPLALFAEIALALGIVTLGSAWLVQQRASRANVAEVMRLAT
ncbi:MAG TPA: FtsX-like permease family protein [Actinomycetota bacterium]